jgi:hypothetical protein
MRGSRRKKLEITRQIARELAEKKNPKEKER